MPLPSKRKDEKQSEFMSRCMSDDIMKKEYKDNKQRVAVCISEFEKAGADRVTISLKTDNKINSIKELNEIAIKVL